MNKINHESFISALKNSNIESIKEQIIKSGERRTNGNKFESPGRKYKLDLYVPNQKAMVVTPLCSYQFYNRCPDKPMAEYQLECVYIHNKDATLMPEHLPQYINWEAIAFEDTDGTTALEKYHQIRTGQFIPLLWVLPNGQTEQYFHEVIFSEEGVLGAIFFSKSGEALKPWESLYKLSDIYIKPDVAPQIVPKIEKWYDMGGNAF